MSDYRRCVNCEHEMAHNLWGRCSEPGCECQSYDPADAQVVVLRHPDTSRPVAIPDEVVREADRVWNAYQAHLGGMSWEQIATTAPGGGWPSAAAVAAEVKAYLDEGRAVFRGLKGAEFIALTYDRLNVLLASVWDAAKTGKVQHVQAARQVIHDQVELLRDFPLSADAEGDTPDGGVPRTLVIGSEGAPASYEQQLREAAQTPGVGT